MSTIPNALSPDGTTTLLTDQHGRGIMLSISQFERSSLDVVTEAAVDDDLSCDNPLILAGIDNPEPRLIHPDRCAPYQVVPPIQTVDEAPNLWTIYIEHYVFILSFAGFFLDGEWTVSENIDLL